VLDD
jgi:hypothetical protein